MYFSACSRISCLRQRHSLLLVRRVPSSFWNGSGSFSSFGNRPASGNAGTTQSAPVFSTLAATAPTPLASPSAVLPVDVLPVDLHAAPQIAQAVSAILAREYPALLVLMQLPWHSHSSITSSPITSGAAGDRRDLSVPL